MVKDSLNWPIHNLHFINNNVGWAVGGGSAAYEVAIFKTIDGGKVGSLKKET